VLRQKIAWVLLDFRCDKSVHPRGDNQAAIKEQHREHNTHFFEEGRTF